MNKEEIERRIKRYELVRECAEENLNELNIQLRDLREVEKLKLRHGDFGYDEKGEALLIHEQANREHPITSRNKEGVPCGCVVEGTHQSRKIARFGNIYDLLKKWSKDLTYFKFDVHHCEINTIEFSHAPIHIAGNWHTLVEAEEIWHKLGQLIATLKKKR